MAAVLERLPLGAEELVKTLRRAVGGVIASRIIEETDRRLLKGKPLGQYNPVGLALVGNLALAFAKQQEVIPEQFTELAEDVRTSFDVLAGTHTDAVIFKKVPYGWCPDNKTIRVINLDATPPKAVIIDGFEKTAETEYRLKDSSAENMTIELTTEMPKGRRDIVVRGNAKAAYIVCYI